VWIYLAVRLPFPAFARVARMGPGHYPIAVAGLIIILALWLLWQTFRSEPYTEKTPSAEAQKSNPQAVKHLISGFGLFLVYVIIMPYLGFALSTALFAFCFIRFIGGFGYLLCTIVALAIPALLWTIFAYLLTVPLPKGPWGV
jgi:putative tricarboxylic transport membrane protein